MEQEVRRLVFEFAEKLADLESTAKTKEERLDFYAHGVGMTIDLLASLIGDRADSELERIISDRLKKRFEMFKQAKNDFPQHH